jgi:hypothetical protein
MEGGGKRSSEGQSRREKEQTMKRANGRGITRKRKRMRAFKDPFW